MIVFTRCYDLLAWLLPRAEKFPRAFRLTVTQRLIDAASDLQEALFESQSQRGASPGLGDTTPAEGRAPCRLGRDSAPDGRKVSILHEDALQFLAVIG